MGSILPFSSSICLILPIFHAILLIITHLSPIFAANSLHRSLRSLCSSFWRLICARVPTLRSSSLRSSLLACDSVVAALLPNRCALFEPSSRGSASQARRRSGCSPRPSHEYGSSALGDRLRLPRLQRQGWPAQRQARRLHALRASAPAFAPLMGARSEPASVAGSLGSLRPES